MFFIDGHCDTLSKALDENKDLYKNDLQYSFYKSKKVGGGIQILASFVDEKFTRSGIESFNRCNRIIKKIEDYEIENNKKMIIRTKDELVNSINNKNTKVILSIENGSAIGGNLQNVKYFYDKGVRIMSVTWNNDNELGCGCNTNNDTGLTQLGIDYIKKLEELNIGIDVSHASEKTFWDIIKIISNPIIATHSNVYNLCNHQRNLKDEQIKAIAKSNGIIGMCYYSKFLNSNKRASVVDIVEHIKYIKNLVGIDYVGFGSDFDGMNKIDTAFGIEDVSKIDNIVEELKKQQFSEEEIEKVLWKNWFRVLGIYFF